MLSGLGRIRARLSAIVTLLALALVVAACDRSGDSRGQQAQRSENLVVAVASDPVTLDNLVSHGLTGSAVYQYIDTLLVRRSDGSFAPSLAAEFPRQIDPLRWEVKLRKGVKFIDGSAVTAQSVADAMNYAMAQKGFSALKGVINQKVKATAPDESTVIFETEAPDALFPGHLIYFNILKVTSDPNQMATRPIGTGPYKVVNHVRGQSIELEANSDYWGSKPYWKKVTFRVIPDEGARVAALKAGEVDVIETLTPTNVAQVPAVLSLTGVEYQGVRLNSRKGLFTDIRVRQALNYAVDHNAIRTTIFGPGAQLVQCQLTAKGEEGFNPSLKDYPYDPDKAKQLLRDAKAEGATFSFVGVAGSPVAGFEQYQQALLEYWQKVGLNPKLTILPYQQWLKEIANQDNQPDAIVGVGANRAFNSISLWGRWVSSKGHVSATSHAGLDAIMNDARLDFDKASRQKKLQAGAAILCDEALMVFGVRAGALYGAKLGLQLTENAGPAGALLSVNDIVYSDSQKESKQKK